LKIAFHDEGDLIILLDGLSTPIRHSERSPGGVGRDAGEESRQSFSAHLAQEFSSSEYSKTIGGIVAGEPPAIDLAAEKRLQDCLVALAAEGAIQSAHDISDGGLAVTLAESCFASSSVLGASAVADCAHFGTHVKLEEEGPAEAVFFNERGARAVVSVPPTSLARVLDTARQYVVGAREIGKVTLGSIFRIEYKGRAVIDTPVETLRDIWANSLERTLKVQ
jgi:phosphoribosylformylglycinamidine synthase subunit PurL